MAASTITRDTWTDDSGTPAAPVGDGTVINNSRLQNHIYARIDELFAGAGAYATLTLGGKFKVEGFGNHAFTAGGTGVNSVQVENTAAGTSNLARLWAKANGATNTIVLDAYSSTFTTTGYSFQNGAALWCEGVGGLSIATAGAGAIRFYTSNAFRGQMTAAGLFSWEQHGAHSFTSSAAGLLSLTLRNSSAGTTMATALYVANDQSATRGQFTCLSSTWTTSAQYVADGVVVDAAGAGGLSVSASHASGVIRVYTGGNTERLRIDASGNLLHGDGTVGAPALSFLNDPDTGIFRSTGNVLAFACGGVASATLSATAFAMSSLALGTGAIRGRELAVGSNTSGSGAAGYLLLYTKTNATTYLWSDDSAAPGVIRVHTSPPTENGSVSDTAGTVVGTQTSLRAAKDILHTLTPADEIDALGVMLQTPVHRFRYKAQWPGETFVGITTDDSPEFGYDGGRAFNPVSAFGYTVASFKAMAGAIRALEAEVRELRARIAARG